MNAATHGRRRPRLGFLGLGWIGRNRLVGLARAGIADVVAVADPLAERCAAAHEIAGDATLCGSLDELLAQRLDGIVIATPSALHAEQCAAALDRGLAVFCQKPLGRDAIETRRIVAAARKADRLLGVDLSYRHTAAMLRIRAMIDGGALGRVYAADLTFHNAYGPDQPWFYDRALAGGGCVVDLGIHLVDLALWALDFPALSAVHARLFAAGEPVRGDEPIVEDFATAQIGLASGAVIRLTCSWRLSAGRDAVIEAAFYGTKGGAALRNVDGSFYDFRADFFRGTATEVLTVPPDEWGPRALVAWAEQLAAGSGFDPAAERLIPVAEALDAIYGRSSV